MTHLSLAQRSSIENLLRDGRSFHEIAAKLKVARSTVKREVLKHRQKSDKGAKGRVSVLVTLKQALRLRDLQQAFAEQEMQRMLPLQRSLP